MAERRADNVAGSVGFTEAIKRVWYWPIVVGAYAVVPVVARPSWADELDVATVVDAVVALALGGLLVVRVNHAYERRWEARTLWGTLVSVSRNLAIKTREIADPDAMERSRTHTLVVAFGHSLKDHLGGDAVLARVPGFEKTGDNPRHVPSYVAGQIYALFSAWRTTAKISGDELSVLDREARMLLDVAGGCERINDTLTPRFFPAIVRQALVLYLLYLPWSLAPELGWLTVPFTGVASYFLIAAEGVASYLERPFGEDDDRLGLESICAAIDSSVTEILES